jgi:hypothetical protein
VLFKIKEECEVNVESLLGAWAQQQCTSHGNAAGLSLLKLKRIATHLGIPSSQTNGELLKAIFNKNELRNQPEKTVDAEATTAYGSSVRKNKNTFPRLANILFADVDRLLSSRNVLQNRQCNDKNPVYVEAVY